MTDLERALNCFKAKQALYTQYWDFYNGDGKSWYLTERIRELFPLTPSFIQENWAATVIDTYIDRIELQGLLTPDNDDTSEMLSGIYEDLDLALEAHEAHRCALITGEAFIIVWKDENGDIECFYNDSRMAHIEYDPQNPRRRAWAAKWWYEQNNTPRIILYYPDRLEYYQAKKKVNAAFGFDNLKPKDFELTDEQANPFGEIPVYHFVTDRYLKSDLKDIIPIHRLTNLFVVNMSVAGEFSVLPQKWVIGNYEMEGNEKLKSAPGGIWEFPGGDGEGQPTSVGQFAAAQMSNFIDVIDHCLSSLSTIAKIPKHIFFRSGGDPSGEALIAMEAPLVKRINNRISRFKRPWKQIGAFILKLQGNEGITAKDVTASYANPATVQPRTKAEIRQININSGIPLKVELEKEGWSAAEIEKVEEAQSQERIQKAADLAAAVELNRQRFDSNGENVNA